MKLFSGLDGLSFAQELPLDVMKPWLLVGLMPNPLIAEIEAAGREQAL